VLAVALWQITTTTAPPAALSTGTAGEAAGTTAVPFATVEVSVSANPPEARIFLEDKPLAGNPATARVPRDGAAHRLRVEAPGYATKLDSITFERDRSMDVVLVKDAAADKPPRHAADDVGLTHGQPALPPPRPSVGGPVVPADDMSRPAGKKPPRTLDTSNPYQ
jgi:hypothetical protein